MSRNPVFREGIQIYLIEGHGFPAYCYTLLLLAPLEFLTLFLPSLDPQTWIGPANLFKLTSVVTLVLVVYFCLRITNQEFAPWRFLPSKRWLQQEGVTIPRMVLAQFALLGLHGLLFILIASPLLIWAGAIARASAASMLFTLFFILFYAVTCGAWGLAAVTLWERRMENREVFVRSFFFSVVFLSALLYLPLNPIAFLLSRLGETEMAPLLLWRWQWSAPLVHFLFDFFLLGSGLALYRWALGREVTV
ncbi:MAG: hypothetical protein HYY45_16605 [Deltaproteobacteria bacterium]|nr:hypothetical protein [Deltaproteobacteria bacterium]